MTQKLWKKLRKMACKVLNLKLLMHIGLLPSQSIAITQGW